jgi:hypothetical protein
MDHPAVSGREKIPHPPTNAALSQSGGWRLMVEFHEE